MINFTSMKLIDKYELKGKYNTDQEVQKDVNDAIECKVMIKVREYKKKLIGL